MSVNRAFLSAVIGGASAAVVTLAGVLALDHARLGIHPSSSASVSLKEVSPSVPVAGSVSPLLVGEQPVAGESTDAQGIPIQPAAPEVSSALPPLLVKYAPLTFAPLVRQVIPAVVNIATTQLAQDGHDHTPPQIRGTPLEKRYHDKMKRASEEMVGAGSGFIVDPTGIIVTNRHVVGDNGRVVVSLSNGLELPAHLLGADPLTDIAVIKVESPEPLPYVTWGDSRQTDIGDWILVAGNPFGFGSSVTAGIVSAAGRDLGIGSLDDFIQLDAPINPGNSGGPAFNMRGQVVAINAAIVTPAGGSVGIGFGIPSEIVAPVVAEIERTGHAEHGWLGITLNDGDTNVSIASVDAGGPAQKSGLQGGDIVRQVDGAAVTSARMLLRSIAAARPGTDLTFVVRRGHGDLNLVVHIGARPTEADD
uniref:S1C family serine protease n=1 Tax=Neokomagataea tanensis TaxID=661191 RepID=UPI000B1EA675